MDLLDCVVVGMLNSNLMAQKSVTKVVARGKAKDKLALKERYTESGRERGKEKGINKWRVGKKEGKGGV